MTCTKVLNDILNRLFIRLMTEKTLSTRKNSSNYPLANRGIKKLKELWGQEKHWFSLKEQIGRAHELQSLMRISYAVFCLKKKNIKRTKEKTRNNERTKEQN